MQPLQYFDVKLNISNNGTPVDQIMISPGGVGVVFFFFFFFPSSERASEFILYKLIEISLFIGQPNIIFLFNFTWCFIYHISTSIERNSTVVHLFTKSILISCCFSLSIIDHPDEKKSVLAFQTNDLTVKSRRFRTKMQK
eukprot:473048_1